MYLRICTYTIYLFVISLISEGEKDYCSDIAFPLFMCYTKHLLLGKKVA